MKINDKAGTCITINPLDPDVIYVAGSDDIVYKTINGGQSWEAVTTPLSLYSSITDIAIDP
ncbi:MAG: WD40/YVTN/BNR-like repeat-containing protein, partial [bacterium]